MEKTSANAMLVDPRDLDAGFAVTATVPRSEVEEALSSDLPVELFLDVERASEEAGTEERTVSVSWERADLERLLADTESSAITLSFAPGELERVFDEDVEAHGLRERALILTVAAAAASGASAVSAAAATDRTTGSNATPAAAQVSHDEAGTASLLATPANDEASLAARGIQGGAVRDEATLASRGIEAPPATHDEATLVDRGIQAPAIATHDEATLTSRGIDPQVTDDGGSGFQLPEVDATTAAVSTGIAGGIALLITAAGFSTRRNRGVSPV